MSSYDPKRVKRVLGASKDSKALERVLNRYSHNKSLSALEKLGLVDAVEDFRIYELPLELQHTLLFIKFHFFFLVKLYLDASAILEI